MAQQSGNKSQRRRTRSRFFPFLIALPLSLPFRRIAPWGRCGFPQSLQPVAPCSGGQYPQLQLEPDPGLSLLRPFSPNFLLVESVLIIKRVGCNPSFPQALDEALGRFLSLSGEGSVHPCNKGASLGALAQSCSCRIGKWGEQ